VVEYIKEDWQTASYSEIEVATDAKADTKPAAKDSKADVGGAEGAPK